jgi:hypothetical protein
MTTQTKIDPRRELGRLYAAHREPAIVEVPSLAFLMIDGHGDPNTSPAYTAALEALFSVSYTAKFLLKKEPPGINFKVMPLEGLWWSAETPRLGLVPKADWDWTMMIMQPDEVRPELVAHAIDDARRRRSLPALEGIRLERLDEGPAAQLLHVGPYAEEGPAIARLHAFIAEQGRVPRGKHHEIYLSDPRRAAPEKLKTIIRQPVGAA